MSRTPGSKKCPLYGNVEEMHEREVKEAEAAARARMLEEDPDLAEEDLTIKVSDAVTRATQDRIRRAGGPDGGYPYGVVMGAGARLGQ